ncbi:MAG TPA: PIN domain-containing protein [Candidatus Binataceae bacterium]|nr:PIN domain-containing protein [Candidatus Binataceae bacterium]
MITCPALLAELALVLSRVKFRPYVAPHEVEAYVALLRRLSLLVPDPKVEAGLTPDPGDDYLVALARTAGAHVLVSGDPHLTQLKDAEPPVLAPRAFLRRLSP